MTPRLLLSLAILLASVAAAPAQPKLRIPLHRDKPPRYEHLPFDGNIQDIVADQLEWSKDLEPLKGLVEQILRDPGKFQLDADSAKKLNLNNPALRQTLKDWIAKNPPD